MSKSFPPIHCVYEDGCFKPVSKHWQEVADEHVEAGNWYYIEEYAERSDKSHRHYFACIRVAWENMPEKWSKRFPTPEHLRKYALIKLGYRDERQIVLDTNETAMKVLQFIKISDPFAVYSLNDNVIIEWTAASQKYRAMGKHRFQKSKDDVLSWVASLVGIDKAELVANAEAAA